MFFKSFGQDGIYIVRSTRNKFYAIQEKSNDIESNSRCSVMTATRESNLMPLIHVLNIKYYKVTDIYNYNKLNQN